MITPARRLPIAGAAAASTLLAFAALPACSGPQRAASADPISAMRNDNLSVGERTRAVDQAWALTLTGEASRESLRKSTKSLVWSRSSPPTVRIAGIDQLAADDPRDTVTMLSLMLPTENHWEVIEHVCDLAAENHWTELTRGLVRSWARPVPDPTDDKRPERRALQALYPGQSVEQTVFDVFTEAGEGPVLGERARQDAWALLSRLDESGALRQRFLSEPPPGPPDALTADLYAAASDLGAVPRTREELEWVRALRRPEFAAFWRESAEAIARLSPQQREGLQIRHAAIIRWAASHQPDWLAASSADLESLLRMRFDGRRDHQRGGSTGGAVVPETIREWRSALVWADLLSIAVAIESIQGAEVVEALFDQASRDRVDTSTEYGGVLDARGDGFVALLYTPIPAQRRTDTSFVAPPEMLEKSADALFQYHFHANRERNADFAGPSGGDLEFVRAFGRACIVFTSIERDVMNADYYQPNGARIDLGEIRAK